MSLAADAAGPAGRATAAGRVGADIVWSFGGTAGYAACQWAVIVATARLTDPASLGRYALGLAVSAPVILLTGLALRTVQVTDSGARYTFRHYLALRLVSMAAAVAVTAVIAGFLGPAAGPVVLLVGLAKAVDGVADIYHGLLQRHGRMPAIAVSLLLNGAGTLGAVTALLAVTGSLVWATAGSVAASAATLFGWCLPASRPYRSSLAAEPSGAWPAAGVLVRLAGCALPLALSSAITSLTANVPRYLVQGRLDNAALGVFAALGYPALAVGVLFGAVAQAALPRMTRSHARRDTAELRALTVRLAAGCLSVGLVGVLATLAAGPALLRMLYGPGYSDEAAALTVLMLGAALGSVVFIMDAALAATRTFAPQLGAAAMALGTVLLCGTLIGPWGLTGAAVGCAAPVAVQLVVKFWLLRDALHRAAGAPTGPPAVTAVPGPQPCRR